MWNKLLVITLLVSIIFVQAAYAELDFDTELSSDEEATIDEILEPVMKVYRFIKYTATVIGVLMLVFAGISFATSGGDNAQKERAKNTAAGVVVGLILIWVAPLIVEYIFT
jgi:type IV secretory pathway VirB2 component (pilin)